MRWEGAGLSSLYVCGAAWCRRAPGGSSESACTQQRACSTSGVSTSKIARVANSVRKRNHNRKREHTPKNMRRRKGVPYVVRNARVQRERAANRDIGHIYASFTPHSADSPSYRPWRFTVADLFEEGLTGIPYYRVFSRVSAIATTLPFAQRSPSRAPLQQPAQETLP